MLSVLSSSVTEVHVCSLVNIVVGLVLNTKPTVSRGPVGRVGSCHLLLVQPLVSLLLEDPHRASPGSSLCGG